MSTFLTAFLVIFTITLVFVGIGFYLMSKLVGGFGNLKALYRLFSGKGRQNTKQRTSHSASGRSSRTRHTQEQPSGGGGQASGKMFSDSEGTYVDFEEVKE